MELAVFFVGFIALFAHRWSDERARRDVAIGLVTIFSIWFFQNFGLMFSGRFNSLMVLNVIGCGAAAGINLKYLFKSNQTR